MGNFISSCKDKMTPSFHSSKKAEQSGALVKESDEKAKQSDILVKATLEKAKKNDKLVKETDEKAKQSDVLNKKPEGKARQSDILVKETEEKAKQNDKLGKETDEKAKQSDILVKETEEEAKQNNKLVKESDEKAKQSDVLNKKPEEKAKQSDILVKDAEEKAKQIDKLGKETDEKAKQKDILVKETEEEAKQNDKLVKETDEKAKQRDILNKKPEGKARQSDILVKLTKKKAKQNDKLVKETDEKAKQSDVLNKKPEEKAKQCDILVKETEEKAKQSDIPDKPTHTNAKHDVILDKFAQEMVRNSELQDKAKETELHNKHDEPLQNEIEQDKLLVKAKEEELLCKAEQNKCSVDCNYKDVCDPFTKEPDQIGKECGTQMCELRDHNPDTDTSDCVGNIDPRRKRHDHETDSHNSHTNSPENGHFPDVIPSEDDGEENRSKVRTSSTGEDNSVVALENKQTAILQRLGELRGVLDQLNNKYGGATTASSSKTSSTMVLPSGVVHDIVINADPENPPAIVFVLFTLLKERCRVYGSSLVHSSVSGVPDQLRNIFSDQDNNCPRGNHQVAITIIWKKVENGPTLIVSPHKQTAIQGEANIARYIMRLINQDYDNSDPVATTQVDDWLDSAQQQLHRGNTKEKASAVKALNARLGRNDWLVGSEISLADMVMWAALFQTNQMSNAPTNVKKWLASCDKNSVFQFAKTVLNGS